MGHLLTAIGVVPDQLMADITEEAKKVRKTQSKYAWLLDKSNPERDGDVTINLHYRRVEADSDTAVLIDTPGDRRFTRTLIAGLSQADCVLCTHPKSHRSLADP